MGMRVDYSSICGEIDKPDIRSESPIIVDLSRDSMVTSFLTPLHPSYD
jgi:hypothetical protein